jgi:hypothetical protein
MKRPVFKPSDFSMTLEECPPGYFLCGDMIGFKTEYGNDECDETYCDSGESFSAKGAIVVPLEYSWVEEE